MKTDYQERRCKDEKDEKIVGRFLDTLFYPTFTIDTTRNTDKATQITGLDVTVSDANGYQYTIDEKAATHWAGKNLQTFAHEVSSIDVAGKEYDGWLLDFNSSSEYLVEVWIDGLNSENGKLNDYTNISDCTIALIKKSDLWTWLKKKNISSTGLKELGEKLRNYNQPYEYYNGFKVTLQMNYQEHAVNILIPRDSIINSISKYAVNIKNNKITVLRKQPM